MPKKFSRSGYIRKEASSKAVACFLLFDLCFLETAKEKRERESGYTKARLREKKNCFELCTLMMLHVMIIKIQWTCTKA